MPSPLPPTRRQTLAEFNELKRKDEVGLQPTLPPTGIMDWLSLPVGEFLNEMSGGSPTMLATARWKKAKLMPAIQDLINSYRRAPKTGTINERDTVFHATDPSAVIDILHQGEIVPDPSSVAVPHPAMEPVKWSDYVKTEKVKPPVGMDRGVSVSRVPRVSSKGSKAVSFVMDNSKMPPTRPYTESVFEKTTPDYRRDQLLERIWLAKENGWPKPEIEALEMQLKGTPPSGSRMNHKFEFENRTYDKAIPKSAMKELWVDKEALGDHTGYDGFGRSVSFDEHLEGLRDLAEGHGLVYREFDDGAAMHAGRLSNLKKRKTTSLDPRR